MIHVAVKLGLIQKQFVLRRDRYVNAVEVDTGGCGEMNLLVLPVSIAMVKKARSARGLGDFDLHSLIVER